MHRSLARARFRRTIADPSEVIRTHVRRRGKDRQRGREGPDTGLPGVGCGQPLKPWPRRRAGQAIGGPLGRASRTAGVITNRLTDRAVARGQGRGMPAPHPQEPQMPSKPTTRQLNYLRSLGQPDRPDVHLPEDAPAGERGDRPAEAGPARHAVGQPAIERKYRRPDRLRRRRRRTRTRARRSPATGPQPPGRTTANRTPLPQPARWTAARGRRWASGPSSRATPSRVLSGFCMASGWTGSSAFCRRSRSFSTRHWVPARAAGAVLVSRSGRSRGRTRLASSEVMTITGRRRPEPRGAVVPAFVWSWRGIRCRPAIGCCMASGLMVW